MAVPKIKATYSLDPETVQVLERTAKRWKVSKSEVLRRAIRAVADEGAESSGLVALERLQRAAQLSEEQANAWIKELRLERESRE